MSANSGIGVSPELTSAWNAALGDRTVRFLKVVIRNELLVHEESIKSQNNKLDDDLALLQNELKDDVPAYILARLDDTPSAWWAISFVPDHAKVRDKMLYASTRAALTKALGASSFPSTLFATSKSDLLPGAYAAFLTAQSAPPPLSEREKDMQAARDAERLAVEAAGGYEGARARVSPLQHSKGFGLAREVEEALGALGNESGDGGRLVVVHIENEKIVLDGSVSGPCTAAELGRKLPASSPSYAFFARPLPDVRHTVFVYSCPSSSPVKQRMLYSSNALILSNSVRTLLERSALPLHPRRIETSEPAELGEKYLRHELVESDEAKAAAKALSKASSPQSRSGTTIRSGSMGGGQGEVEAGGNVSSVRGAIAAMEARAAEASLPAPSSGGFARPKGPGRKR